MHRFTLLFAMALIALACGGSETSSDTEATSSTTATQETEASTTTTEAPTTTAEASTTTAESTTTTEATTTTLGEPVLTQDGDNYMIVWASTQGPTYKPAIESAASPFFHIHNNPNNDGFFFGLEMYTTGYGALWTGETGTIQVLCMEAPPAPNSTGICPWFDPDGPGPIEPFSAFGATGTITINRLDADGYDVVVNEVVYAEGGVVTEFHLVGP